MNNFAKITLVVALVFIIGIALDQFIKKTKLEERNRYLENNNHRLRKLLLEKYGYEPSVVMNEIDHIIAEFERSGRAETVKSLQESQQLYRVGFKEQSIKQLMVIIENRLKEKLEAKKDSWFFEFKEKERRFLGLKALINRAKEIQLFNEFEYSVAVEAINVRNGVSHHEGFEQPEMKNEINFYGCVELLKKFVPNTKSPMNLSKT